MFINEDIVDKVAQETKKYALFLNCAVPRITPDEIIVFWQFYSNWLRPTI